MGHRSCSLRPESARGRVMMALPVDVAGPRPRPGDVGAPPKLGSNLSSVAEAEPEPPGSGEAEVVRQRPGRSPSPGSGGAEFAVFRDIARVRAVGRVERSSPSSGT